MPSKPKVYFFYQQVNPHIENRSRLKKFIELIFRKEGKQLGTLNYIFCTDRALLNINRKYLGHDFYTDIITFNLSENDIVQAEIYISINRVRENAKSYNSSFKTEIHRVIFHGVLHLCGYRDKTKKDTENMRHKEDFYLFSYFNK
jgi:rRNA maturation RNase YbeY